MVGKSMRRLRLALICWIAISSMAIPCLLVWGWYLPCGQSPLLVTPLPVASETSRSDQRPSESPKLEDFADLLDKRLRCVLVDRPVVAVEMPDEDAIERLPVSYKLLATTIEPDRAYALFATERGVVELRTVGDTVGDAELGPRVLKIERRKVVVSDNGVTRTLELLGGPGNG